MKKLIIGFTGAAGVGKDTAADYLVEKYNAVKLSFADPIKRIVKDLFRIDSKSLWGESKLRNVVDERYGCSPRHILQQIGTEHMRSLYENVWIDYFENLVNKLSNNNYLIYYKESGISEAHNCQQNNLFTLSDIRYSNESDAIHRMGGYVIKLNRETSITDEKLAAHSSEQSFHLIKEDLLIDNSGTREDMYKQIEDFLCKCNKS